jgi:hypothetical protein
MKTLRSLARSKRLLGVNALLAGLSVGFSIYIVWEMTAPLSPSMDTPSRPVNTAIVEPDNTPRLATPAVTAAIASRNLFSPTRTDAQRADSAVIGTPGLHLNLFGVVLAGERSIAYLEDPTSKRVYAYRLGDSVAGATIRVIEASHIVLERRNQRVDVQLHDPSRPKPSLPVVVAAADGADLAARPATTDNRTDTMSSATWPTSPAAQPLQSRPPVSRFGIVAPAIPRAR